MGGEKTDIGTRAIQKSEEVISAEACLKQETSAGHTKATKKERDDMRK